ncbi:oligosaccharide flippase family protein [Patescibacteria group bacterium]|nr:oligosaccharide flippase family protein [Patescibacteria group bacterium]MBU1953038.1 oligosaccharide flippase family protein [Patescibacteria group bacterium]
MSNKETTKNSDIQQTIIVGAGTLIGAFFSYLLQFVLGRKLSVSDYGSFNVLLSLSSLVSVPISVFGISLIKIVSELYVRGEKGKMKKLFLKLSVASLLLGFVFTSVFFFLRFRISSGFKVESVPSITLFAVLLGLGFLSTLPPVYLQGLQKFKKYSAYQVLGSFNRFVIPTLLVFAGFGLVGVFGGMVGAALLTFVLSLLLIRGSFKVTGSESFNLNEYYKKLISFSLPVLFVNFFLIALNNMDLIMVKRFFSGLDAGYYAGTATLGKIFLFGSGAVSVIMFPKITGLYAKGEGYLKEFKKLTSLLIFIVIAGVICYHIFPQLLTHLFFGKTFENSIQFLPLFSIFIGLYILISFFVMFFLAIDKKKVSLLLLPGVLLQYILLNIYHVSLFQVIWVNIIICIITLSLLIIYLYAQVIKCPKILQIKN